MKILNDTQRINFLSLNPTIIGTHENSLGQVLTFLEHPTKGDEAPVYCLIEGFQGNTLGFINTGFYDLDDMVQDHEEYTPFFVKGTIQLGL